MLLRSGDLTGFSRRLLGWLRRLGRGGPVDYATWHVRHVMLTDGDRARIDELAAALPRRSTFTLVVEVGPGSDPDHI